MSFQDKSIQCSDCGATFTFSAGEQEQFASRGYTNEPKSPQQMHGTESEVTDTLSPSLVMRASDNPAKIRP